jgi:membrane-bound metal-dependent hydrolase YbcI (DUF457 family)
MVAGAPAIGAPGHARSGATPIGARGWADDLRRAAWQSAPFMLCAIAPDLDLLVGLHSRYTHSLGAAALIAIAVAWLAPRDRRDRRWTLALACGCAWASHVLLDWLGNDTSPPRGIMALWPWSSAFYLSSFEWFPATDRRYWLPGFLSRNLLALWWELILLVPLVALTWWLRRPRWRANASSSSSLPTPAPVRRKLPSS